MCLKLSITLKKTKETNKTELSSFQVMYISLSVKTFNECENLKILIQ